MPYREIPSLNFTGIHVASICGDNGSGKSSIIDAITWALWGKTRAKSDDDLIHQGETAMHVQFDYAVGQQMYRVIRKHTRARSSRTSGQSSLDLFVSNDGNFRPISGDRITETEKRIVDILHMDYDTFINSAFLRQGHADQFTVARPTERKAVLGNILGLSTYDRFEAQARQMAGKLENEKSQLENTLQDIERQLALQPEYEDELAEAQKELKAVEEVIAGCQTRLLQLRQQRETLNVRRQQLDQLDEQIAQTSKDLNRWSEQAKQNRARASEYQNLLDRRKEIEEGHALLLSCRKQNEELNQKFRLMNNLNDHAHKIDMAIVQASQSLLREHALVTGKVNDLLAKFQKVATLKVDLQRSLLEQTEAVKSDEIVASRRLGLLNLQSEIRQMDSDRVRTEHEIIEINEKLDLLANEHGAKCPLCEQDLTDEHLDLIKRKYIDEKQAKSETVRVFKTEISRKKAESSTLEQEIIREESTSSKSKSAAQIRVGLLTRELAEAEEAGRQLDLNRELVARLEERLARKDYAEAEQAARGRIDEQLAALGYDAASHDRIRQDISSLEQWDLPKRKLEEAEIQLEQITAVAARAEQAAQELQNNLEALAVRKIEVARELQSLPSVDAALSQTELEYQDLNAKQSQARESLGSAREKLNRCAQLEINRKDKAEMLTQAAKEEGIYRELAEAFGKRGIQALLIEVALPEIEDETNRLLARMTDNRMHVKFETQRETKKGDVLETLDIGIADELGTRSYEMFSGGEAFRINFAIRIALSKVLARRAGAPLPTLIVDEGFGTQDVNGIEKLKEAITSVQDDFEKILVITHIEDFRDAFPVRIDVVKTADGSVVEVN